MVDASQLVTLTFHLPLSRDYDAVPCICVFCGKGFQAFDLPGTATDVCSECLLVPLSKERIAEYFRRKRAMEEEDGCLTSSHRYS